MKFIFEKEDFQLLGQLALELIRSGPANPGDELCSYVFIEFYQENIDAFTFPQRRSRKLKLSQHCAILSILKKSNLRSDPLWDAVLIELREKLERKSHDAFKTLPIP